MANQNEQLTVNEGLKKEKETLKEIRRFCDSLGQPSKNEIENLQKNLRILNRGNTNEAVFQRANRALEKQNWALVRQTLRPILTSYEKMRKSPSEQIPPPIKKTGKEIRKQWDALLNGIKYLLYRD